MLSPMSPGKPAALSKDVFKQNEVCFITNNPLRGQHNGFKSRYMVIGAKPKAKQHVTQARTVDDSAFIVTIKKVKRQSPFPWTKGRPAPEKEKSQEIAVSVPETHLNELCALHKSIGAFATHLNAAHAKVKRLRST